MRVRDLIDEAKEYCGLLLSSANKPALKWILWYKRYYKHRPPITRPAGSFLSITAPSVSRDNGCNSCVTNKNANTKKRDEEQSPEEGGFLGHDRVESFVYAFPCKNGVEPLALL